MNEKANYQLLLDALTERYAAAGKRPRVLLHSCCGPCSSYVLEYLTRQYDCTVFYYNPNMDTEEEYQKRVAAQKRLLEQANYPSPVELIIAEYDHEPFLRAVAGQEGEPEGGKRCETCFRLRLKKTAELAKEGAYDYFCTTLTVSPHKNAGVINRVGKELAEELGIAWLPSDFKKREGYKRSTELSRMYSLYRQQYCGCEFSNWTKEKPV